jgi:hypothetical protein
MIDSTNPRTWTLRGHAEGSPTVAGHFWQSIGHDEEVPVIELEPVLDLLEAHWRLLEAAPRLPNERCYESWRTMGDFLREHRRLP